MAQLGIDHSKKVLVDLGKLAADGIHIAKHGIGLGSLKQLWSMVDEAKDLIIEAQAAFGELKDLDSQESGQLASACFDLVKGVIDAVVA